MTFQFKPLSHLEFSHLYGLSDAALAEKGIVTMTASSSSGYPCRVSLEEAELGDRLLLLNYEHLPVESPYRSKHAIFVRDGAQAKQPQQGKIPETVAGRLVSIRAFDKRGMMTDATVTEGDAIEKEVVRLLLNSQTDYLHVHTAVRGCYLAAVERL